MRARAGAGAVTAGLPAVRAELAARLAREVSCVALVGGATVVAATRDVLTGAPQVLAAAFVLAMGGRRDPLRVGVAGRLALTAAALAFAVAPGGDARFVLARFLAAITAVTLLQTRSARDHGLLLVTGLLQMALAAALSASGLVAAAALAFVVFGHRALAAFHLLGAATRAGRAGGGAGSAAESAASLRAGTRAALACAALAVPLFAALPRAEVPLFPVSARRELPVGGIGEEVSLRALGPRAGLEVVVGQVEPLDAAARDRAPYFRARSYEEFDGVRWRGLGLGTEPAHHIGTDPIPVGIPAGDGTARFDVALEAGDGEPLLLPEGTHTVEFHDPRPERAAVERSGLVYAQWAAPPRRVAYRATASAQGSGAPRGNGLRRRALLAVPAVVDREAIEPLVREVVAAAGSDVESRAEALATWVRSRCAYALDGPEGDASGVRGTRDPVGEFLLRRRRGHCEHFASALAVCCRIAGVPARVVAGYHATRWNDVGGFWVLRRGDAHAWVECALEGGGWLRVDATPADARGDDPYVGLGGWLARVRDASSYLWSRHVLGYDAAARRAVVASVADALKGAFAQVATPHAGVPVAVAAAVLLVPWLRRRVRARPTWGARRRPAVAFYRRALRSLERRGLGRLPSESAGAHARRVGPVLGEAGSEALGSLAAAFEEVRYGSSAPPEATWTRARLDRLARSRPSRRQAVLSLRP